MRLRVALLALLTAAPVAISAAPQSDLSRAETEERNLRDQLATISRSLKELRAELVALEEKAAALRETQETHSAELAAAEAGLASREGQVEALIRTLYKLQKSGAIQQAFAAESASDVRRQTQYLKVVLQEISRLTSAYVAEARAHREALEKVAIAASKSVSLEAAVGRRISEWRLGMCSGLRDLPRSASFRHSSSASSAGHASTALAAAPLMKLSR